MRDGAAGYTVWRWIRGRDFTGHHREEERQKATAGCFKMRSGRGPEVKGEKGPGLRGGERQVFWYAKHRYSERAGCIPLKASVPIKIKKLKSDTLRAETKMRERR